MLQSCLGSVAEAEDGAVGPPNLSGPSPPNYFPRFAAARLPQELAFQISCKLVTLKWDPKGHSSKAPVSPSLCLSIQTVIKCIFNEPALGRRV